MAEAVWLEWTGQRTVTGAAGRFEIGLPMKRAAVVGRRFRTDTLPLPAEAIMVVDGGMLISLGVALFGLGFAVFMSAEGWVRLKRFERESQRSPGALDADAGVAARLARIEQIVETTALEVERVGESQRYAARALTEQSPARPVELGAPARVVTPH